MSDLTCDLARHPLLLNATLRQLEQDFSASELMQQAGKAAAELAMQMQPDKSLPMLILAGPGNNGGDALEAARLLRQQGYDLDVVLPSGQQTLPHDAEAARQRFLAAGGSWITEVWSIDEEVKYGLIIDGLFGIGLSKPLSADFADLVELAHCLKQKHACPILALDCPSGLNAETGVAQAICIVADVTLTFIADKPGLHTLDGPDYCGRIEVADLGIPSSAIKADAYLFTAETPPTKLARRKQNSHKGSYGNAGILGGSQGMLGAAFLAARACLCLGAGRVFLAPLDSHAPSWDSQQPELMLRSPTALFAQNGLHALGCGPGLGASDVASQYLNLAFALPIPLVLDADALNLLAAEMTLAHQLKQRRAATILTPHPLEAARLLGCSVAEIQRNRWQAALRLAQQYQSYVLLKGCGSIIACPNGQWWVNGTGNPGMASAGMGDVLTGIITALLTQGYPVAEALCTAVFVHGLAADTLVQTQGLHRMIGITASETIVASRQVINQFAW